LILPPHEEQWLLLGDWTRVATIVGTAAVRGMVFELVPVCERRMRTKMDMMAPL